MIRSARLTLVPPAERHFPALRDFLATDRAAARGWAMQEHEAWRQLAYYIGHHALRGFGPLVAETFDGQPIGIFGPNHPHGQPEPEIMWIVWNPEFEGKGIAREAATAARAFAYGTLGWPGAVSYIAPDNARSQALATALGARYESDWTTPRGTTVGVWRHPSAAELAA